MSVRTLVLLRHAKAEGFAGTDEARPLALRGRRQSSAVGDELAASGPLPDLALVSSAARTRQTWEVLASRLPREVDALFLEELYHSGPRGVLEVLAEHAGDAATVIVVGHEPVMSAVAALLASEDSEEALVNEVRHGVSTATRSVLTFDGEWAELRRGSARLISVVRAPEVPGPLA